MKGLVDRFRHRLFWALPTVHTFQLQAGQDGVFSFTNIKARAGVRTMWTSGRLCQRVIATSAICSAPHSSVALSAVCPLPSCWAIPCLSVPICRPWQRFGQCCVNSCLGLQLYLTCHRCPWLLASIVGHKLLWATCLLQPTRFWGWTRPRLSTGESGPVQSNRFERCFAILS